MTFHTRKAASNAARYINTLYPASQAKAFATGDRRDGIDFYVALTYGGQRRSWDKATFEQFKTIPAVQQRAQEVGA